MSTKCQSNLFCYVCGLFTPNFKSKSITKTIKNRYDNYFYPIKLCGLQATPEYVAILTLIGRCLGVNKQATPMTVTFVYLLKLE